MHVMVWSVYACDGVECVMHVKVWCDSVCR